LLTSHRSTCRHELVSAALLDSKGGCASEILDFFLFQIIDISVVIEVTNGVIGDFGVLRMKCCR
jgi:hypothetical protein